MKIAILTIMPRYIAILKILLLLQIGVQTVACKENRTTDNIKNSKKNESAQTDSATQNNDIDSSMVFSDYEINRITSDVKIDSIAVYKAKRKMEVYSKGKLLKTYNISLGGQPVGAKEFEGDLKTPEGHYAITDRNPNSLYHKNLHVSYPNKEDIAYAKSKGKNAGGQIKIHGIGKHINPAVHLTDWTLGCIAVTDKEIDELYISVKTGAKINIKP